MIDFERRWIVGFPPSAGIVTIRYGLGGSFSYWSDAIAIRRPSGDHEIPRMSVPRTRDRNTRRTRLPSARIVYTSGGRANAIRRPLGDQVGFQPAVSRSAPDPSGRTRETY